MKENLKNRLRRWLPPAGLDLYAYAKSLALWARSRELLARNAELRDRYRGETVYILGNGPSLNNFDLDSIRGQRVITMNHFELHPMKDAFEIVAHCVGESHQLDTWEDPTPMIEGVRAASYWFAVDAEPAVRRWRDRDLRFYLAGVRPGAALLDGGDLTGVALIYQSTAQMAINVALHLGFHDIRLLGFDHDWLATRGHSPHFYEEPEGMEKADFSRIPYIEMIRISLRLFEIYQQLARLAHRRGARIRNLSEPSFLDVFPRMRPPPAAIAARHAP